MIFAVRFLCDSSQDGSVLNPQPILSGSLGLFIMKLNDRMINTASCAFIHGVSTTEPETDVTTIEPRAHGMRWSLKVRQFRDFAITLRLSRNSLKSYYSIPDKVQLDLHIVLRPLMLHREGSYTSAASAAETLALVAIGVKMGLQLSMRARSRDILLIGRK